MQIVIIGSGNVAYHLAKAFTENQIPVKQLFGRNEASLEKISSELGISYSTERLEPADLYIIAVKDDAIGEVSKIITDKNSLVAHTSGSTRMEILAGEYRKASFYPLQTFSKEKKLDYSKIPFFIDAENENDKEILMKVLFIADPMASFKTYKDTTYAMMREMAKRGWQLFHTLSGELSVREGLVVAQAAAFEFVGAKNDDDHEWFKAEAKVQTALKDFDAVIMRTDPPFDMQYLYATQFLTLAEQQSAKVFNSGQAMRDFNEKLAILNFSQFTAPTLVTTRSADVRAFLKEHGDIIIKPLDGMGGMGIFRLTEKDPNIGSILETLMQLDSRTIMAQRYIPEIVHGDKRILIIGGEVVPYALARIPQNGETRGNLAAGGRGVAQELSERDREIAETLAPELKRRGILLAGLDVIGSNLTEVNVTSPTGFQEIMKQKNFDVAAMFADAVEAWSKQ